MQKPGLFLLSSILLGITCAGAASAHFQMLYPGDAARMPGRDLDLLMIFTHPFEGGPTMEMARPNAFYVIQRTGWGTSKRHDLMEKLNPIKWRGMDGGEEAAYRATLPAKEVRSMGDYVFVLEPAPYLEKTEEIYIQQFTKTVVNVGGVPGNWHEDVGLPAEIRPLDRPYANWVGGVFRGTVLSNGNPAPGAEIEVQYVNHKPDPASNGWKGKPAITAPHPSYESMSIRADAQGNFAVGLPKAGWWGIAALGVGPQKEFQGKSLSQDAVLWIEAQDMK